mmetsp:Transcript_21201/g.60602  ORF Transcript_21201/g.60602 Transcript_21201/m.60602 type:complete len:281 (-) Transcript_21201:20-862(-)
MELSDLEQGLKSVASSGHSLNCQELLGMQAALSELRRENKFLAVHFWGKIYGVAADYYVAFALKDPDVEFPPKVFFYAGEDFQFQPLPQLTAETAASILALNLVKPFSGVPSRPLVPETDEAQPAELPEGAAAAAAELTEAHRLAQAVHEIDFDTAVVPKGAFVLNEANAVVRNSDFRGLTPPAAGRLAGYAHFRPPASVAALRAHARSDAEFFSEFLDPLEGDLPRGCWAVRQDTTAGLVTLRSLVWQGYTAYHIPETTKFGGAYFGYAQKSSDLPFTI